MIGRVLGHYRIVAEMDDDSRSVGRVFRGRDERDGGDVEIRVLRQWEHPVRTELLHLTSLIHPNIPRFLGLETLDESPCLIYEFSPGKTLAERQKAGPLPQHEAIRICVEIANALEAGHRQNTYHGWLCPRFVRLGPHEQVKVMSFGLAQAIGIDTGFFIDLLWESLAEYLALDYMAPEAGRSFRPYKADPPCDIWSLGVILYETVVGKLPFDSRLDFRNVIRPKPQFPQFLHEVPSNLLNVIERCLATKPGKRFQQASEAKAALQAITQDL